MDSDGPHLALSPSMHDTSSTWLFARRMYESLKRTPHEPTARAYLESTARLVLARYNAGRRDRIMS